MSVSESGANPADFRTADHKLGYVSQPETKTFPLWLTVAAVVGLLVVLGGGAWFYHEQEREQRQDTEAALQAVARLKMDLISRWMAERRGDAAFVAENPFLIEAVVRRQDDPQPEAEDRILSLLRSMQKHYRYSDAFLVDTGGKVLLSLSGNTGPLPSTAVRSLAQAFREQQPVFIDLHRPPSKGPPHMDVIAPMFIRGKEPPVPLAGIFLSVDAREHLYPLVELWPTPSRSAETLLVRREGDEVVFLNELRHRKDTALELRIPIDRREVPAVMAVLGTEGVFQGRDYRGVEVLAAIGAVPGTQWFMVAKVDLSEVFAAQRFRSVTIAALVISIAILLSVAVGMVWQRNAKTHYRMLFEKETARREAEERYRITLMSIGEGVITTDANGRVTLMNSPAQALTGYSLEESHGKPLEDVFHIIEEATRGPVENPVRRVIREGLVVGLANHTLLVAKDGTERPISDTGAPILDDTGAVSGVVLVFSDKTTERAAERTLLEDKRRLAEIIDFLPDATFV
ncbi:MAG: PAS domain-containing protein, partial [Pseudomonadota bacterium]